MNDEIKKYSNNEDINIRELLILFWQKRIFIALCTSVFFVGSIIYVLTVEPLYQSSATLQIVSSDASAGSGNKQGGIGGAANLIFNSGGASQDYVLAQKTIFSRDFFKHLISFDGVLAQLVAYESYNPRTKKLIFDSNIFDSENQKWLLSYDPLDNNDLTYLKAFRTYKSLLKTSWQKDESEFLYLTMVHASPYFAREFLNLVITELNSLVRQRKYEEATKSLEYLNLQLSQTSIAGVRSSINSLIKAQLNTQMLTQVRKDYLLTPLDIPYIPDERFSPRRTFITILFTIIGFIISLVLTVIYRYNFEQINKT